jgi:hypothetical protein
MPQFRVIFNTLQFVCDNPLYVRFDLAVICVDLFLHPVCAVFVAKIHDLRDFLYAFVSRATAALSTMIFSVEDFLLYPFVKVVGH